MKTKHFVSLTLAIALTIMSTISLAQEKEESFSQEVQVTFAYPLGTNGVDAISVSNNLSFNVLYGVNGGLNGVELGGILNYNHGDVNGTQLSGVANINKERTDGLMLAGVYNLSIGDASGVQIADINNALGDYTGVQVGVINYAGRLKGVQIGLINVVGEDNGAVPIGLINVVKDGYYELELVSGEVLYTNLNYKMGVERFYTIFKVGCSTYHNRDVYSVGIGFGGIVTLAEKHKMSIDLSTNQIVFNDDWESFDENNLSKLDINYRLILGEHVSLIAGPSFNYYYSEVRVDDRFGTLKIPYEAHTIRNENSQEWMWVGFNCGIAYRF